MGCTRILSLPIPRKMRATLVGLACLLSLNIVHGSETSRSGAHARSGSNSEQSTGTWPTAGQDWRQRYYSPLKGIHAGNVRQLGFAWAYDIPVSTSLAATPLVVNGAMFTSGNRGSVFALDPRHGTALWVFEPVVNPETQNCCGGVNRGVALWNELVYVAALDGMLYALEASSGRVRWKVDTIIDKERSYSSTGAPYVAGGAVVIGNSGGEYDTRGYITAYNLATGKQLWRFFVVPGDPKRGFEHPEMEFASKSWDPNSRWDLGLGGNAWDGMAYDPALNLLYVGTGNGLPWDRKLRSPAGGDNLFLASILAIDARSGRLVWYYQTTPGDRWDFNAAQKMILADLDIGGAHRKVLMQAPKNGFFYVLDRETGALISADPYVYVNWASGVDRKTGVPVETGKADYTDAPKLVFPSSYGGHNWSPMAFNPDLGLVYVPVLEAGEVFGSVQGPWTYRSRAWNIGVALYPLAAWKERECNDIPDNWPSIEVLRGAEPDPSPRTFLKAWDPVRKKSAWQVETTGPSRSAVAFRRSAGAMTTASGLVFQGDSAGHLRVFDGKNGELLRSVDLGSSVVAAPMTYMVGSDQYVAVMAGVAVQDRAFVDYQQHGQGRVIALKLGGGAVPPLDRAQEPAGNLNRSKPPVPDETSMQKVHAGKALFERFCVACHVSTGRAPDLTRMDAADHEEFHKIVRGGARQSKGMPSFKEVFNDEDATLLHAYIINQAWKKFRCEVKSDE